jgi:YD repeat-containing protein
VGNKTTLTYTYDDAQRLSYVTDNLGNKISYTLDPLGKQTTVQSTDATGILAASVSHVYNNMSWRTNTIADNRNDTYGYDLAGNLISHKNAANNITLFNYDSLQRPVNTTNPDQGIIQTTYNSLDQTTQIKGTIGDTTQAGNIGQLTSINSPDVLQNYQYDTFGRLNLSSQTRAIQNNTAGFTGYTTQYTYNAGGQLAGITYLSGMKVDYQYANGQVINVLVNGIPYLINLQYNSLGALKKWLI